jgi:hypothetical protein
LRGYSKFWHGRLLRNIDNMNESYREAQNFADAIDVILYIEG